VRHGAVTVRLVTYTEDCYEMSQRDVEMARQISAAARRLGLSSESPAVQSLLVIPGATSTAELMMHFTVFSVLVQQGRISAGMADALRAEARRRSQEKQWFAVISPLLACWLAKPHNSHYQSPRSHDPIDADPTGEPRDRVVPDPPSCETRANTSTTTKGLAATTQIP
jgi:hypothetical protein